MSAVRVTKNDVRRWMLTVVRMQPDTFRAEAYVKAYNVREKIRREKLARHPLASTQMQRQSSDAQTLVCLQPTART
jgi:hypothetical protein